MANSTALEFPAACHLSANYEYTSLYRVTFLNSQPEFVTLPTYGPQFTDKVNNDLNAGGARIIRTGIDCKLPPAL